MGGLDSAGNGPTAPCAIVPSARSWAVEPEPPADNAALPGFMPPVMCDRAGWGRADSPCGGNGTTAKSLDSSRR